MTEPSQYFKGRTVQEQMNEVIGYVDVRSAEVATNAIAADVAQVHSDAADAHADALAAAASAAAAAGTLANAVKKTGEASQNIAGDIAVAGNLSGGTVTVPTPVNNTDAASKKYVDDQDALDVKLAGNQTVNDVKTFSSSPVVPTEATGTFSTKAANSTKVKNELDNYAPMVRDTGNKEIAGIKTFKSIIKNVENPAVNSSSTDGMWKEVARWENVSGNWHGLIEIYNPVQMRYALVYYNLATNFHQIRVIAKANFTAADIALNYNADGSTCRLMLKNAGGSTGLYVKYNTFVSTPTPLNVVNGEEYSDGNFPEANTVFADYRGWDQP